MDHLGYTPNLYIYIYIYYGCNGSQNSCFSSIRHSGVSIRYVLNTGAGQLVTSQCWKISVFESQAFYFIDFLLMTAVLIF